MMTYTFRPLDAKRMTDAAIIVHLAGVMPGSPLAAVLSRRADIMTGSQAAHDAVLIPRDPGGLSHGVRAALAARMAVHLCESGLAAHYRGLMEDADTTGDLMAVADPALSAPADARIAAMVRYIDIVTLAPRNASATDITRLKAAGISEPDIVRLSELAAFVNYQARVIAGLKLLVGLK
jgi:uncharacterized protein YciW